MDKKLQIKLQPFSLETLNVLIVKLSGYFDTTNNVKNAFVDILQKNPNLILDFKEVTGVFIDLFHGFMLSICQM